jgi:hypothetical protein
MKDERVTLSGRTIIMGRMIAKFGGKYCEWSTVVDAPVTYLMEKDDFVDYIRQEYGKTGLVELPQRMERVELNGTSSLDGRSEKDLIRYNRAGENESRITTQKALIERYTFKEKT